MWKKNGYANFSRDNCGLFDKETYDVLHSYYNFAILVDLDELSRSLKDVVGSSQPIRRSSNRVFKQTLLQLRKTASGMVCRYDAACAAMEFRRKRLRLQIFQSRHDRKEPLLRVESAVEFVL